MLKEQGSYNMVQNRGHKGSVLRPMCIGPGEGPYPNYNSILFYSESYYIIINKHKNFHTLLQSTTAPQLLMLSCDINQLLNVETKQIFEILFNSLKEKKYVKIILTTQSENYTYISAGYS